MRLTHLGHACLLVETSSVRVLVDPGTYSPGWEGLTELDAVLVTHAHPDHVDWERLPALLADNPGARFVVEPDVSKTQEASTWSATALAAGESTQVGDVTVQAVGGRHAVIHADVPRIGNIGYVLAESDGARLFHPGDSYEMAPEGVDLLAAPLHAPWAAAKELIDFARTVGPRFAVPIHDALLSDAGRALYLRLLATQGGRDGAPLDVRDLAGASAVDL